MKTKTFRDYLNDSSFEDIWTSIVGNFSEPENIKPVYAEYYEKLKDLPHKPVKGCIELECLDTDYPIGMSAAPDWLIDKEVKTDFKDNAMVAAALLYWASLHTFYTSKEHDADLFEYLDIIESDNPQDLSDYLTKSMGSKPYRAEKEESIERKERLFWEETFSYLYAGDWRYILYILKKKLQYDMGFMRGFADHAGRERDADRMQLCCNLIDGATADIYPDERGCRMLHLLFKVLDRYITGWID